MRTERASFFGSKKMLSCFGSFSFFGTLRFVFRRDAQGSNDSLGWRIPASVDNLAVGNVVDRRHCDPQRPQVDCVLFVDELVSFAPLGIHPTFRITSHLEVASAADSVRPRSRPGCIKEDFARQVVAVKINSTEGGAIFCGKRIPCFWSAITKASRCQDVRDMKQMRAMPSSNKIT